MFNSNYGMGFGGPMGLSLSAPLLFLLVLWTLFWKGLALWHSGRRDQPWWFIILLIVNTAGLLEIIYLFLVLKLKLSELFTKK